jgi:hypothetical protein
MEEVDTHRIDLRLLMCYTEAVQKVSYCRIADGRQPDGCYSTGAETGHSYSAG